MSDERWWDGGRRTSDGREPSGRPRAFRCERSSSRTEILFQRAFNNGQSITHVHRSRMQLNGDRDEHAGYKGVIA